MTTLTKDRIGGDLSVREMMADERRANRAERNGDDKPKTETVVHSMRDYALMIPEPKAGMLNLVDFPYQVEPFYSDEVAALEKVVTMKATQVGASAAEIRWGLRQVDVFGDTVIYYFPTDNHVTDFNDERIDPSIQDSDYLRRRIRGVNQKHLKQIGLGTLYVRGVKSLTAVQSVAADAVVFDEYDEADQKNMAQAERRLSGSRAAGRTPRRRMIGRPTMPGYGIAKQYRASDQRVWMVTCPSCDRDQDSPHDEHRGLTFWANLRWKTAAAGDRILKAGDDAYEQREDVIDAWRACRFCEASLEPTKRGEPSPIHDGRWEATKTGPGRIRGYHVTRFCVPFTDLKELVVASRGTRPYEIETFYNNDLGIPYAAVDAALTEEQLNRASGMGRDPQSGYVLTNPTTMGVDVASRRALTVRISEIDVLDNNRRKALWIGEVDSFERVTELMVEYNVHMAVVDHLPETRSSMALASEFPGRVFLCAYNDNWKSKAMTLDPDPHRMLITVNRTQAFDAMMDSIRSLRNLPLRVPPERYYEQMMAPKRVREEDDRGNERRVYVSDEPDDYAHAEVYDLVAAEALGMMQTAVADVQEGEHEVEPDAVAASDWDYHPGMGEA